MATTARKGPWRQLRAAPVSEPMHAPWPFRRSFCTPRPGLNLGGGPAECATPGEPPRRGSSRPWILALDIWHKDHRHSYTRQTTATLRHCLTRRLHAFASSGGRRIASPQGEHRRPPAFLLWHFGVIFFLALVDLCDLGHRGMCKGGERERERERDIYIYIYIYWIAYEIITRLCTMT